MYDSRLLGLCLKVEQNAEIPHWTSDQFRNRFRCESIHLPNGYERKTHMKTCSWLVIHSRKKRKLRKFSFEFLDSFGKWYHNLWLRYTYDQDKIKKPTKFHRCTTPGCSVHASNSSKMREYRSSQSYWTSDQCRDRFQYRTVHLPGGYERKILMKMCFEQKRAFFGRESFDISFRPWSSPWLKNNKEYMINNINNEI